jgi:hypothetical protein
LLRSGREESPRIGDWFTIIHEDLPMINTRLAAVMACGFMILAEAGCSDSTGPGTIDANSALQSLKLGLAANSGIGLPADATTDGAISVIGTSLGQIGVNIGANHHTMFALGLRETFPDGTCQENVFVDPTLPPDPGVCTPFPLGLALVLWESHSASAPPDRIVLIASDEGAVDFSFDLTDPSLDFAIPGIAFYIEGQDSFWLSNGGTLTSAVAATGQNCTIPNPPYAASATCSFATFDEQGAISFESESGTDHVTLTIPRQTLHGIWEQITATQPITLTLNPAVPLRAFSHRLLRAVPAWARMIPKASAPIRAD